MSTNGTSLTGAAFKAEMERRRDQGLGIHADDVPFQMNRQVKALGGIWCKYGKEWLFPTREALRQACDLVGVELDAWDDAAGDAGDVSETPDAPEPGELESVKAALAAREEEVLSAASALAALRQENARLAADLDAARKAASAPASAPKGHNLTDEIVQKVAMRAGKAAIDAILDELFALRADGVKPEETKEERFALARRLLSGVGKAIESDAAPTPKTPAAPRKDVVAEIWIERAEGPSDLCVERTFKGETARQDAEAWIRSNATTAPKTGGYDKHDFRVTWEDGDTFSGRFDLTAKGEDDTGNFCVVASARRSCEFYAGFWTPGHLTHEQHESMLARHAEGNKETLDAYLARRAAILAERFGVTEPKPGSLVLARKRAATFAPEAPKAAPTPAPAPSTPAPKGGASAIMARLAARKGKGAK